MENGIKEKIRKLLALAESPNSNEGAAAMAKAKKLMSEFGLEQKNIEYEKMHHQFPGANWRNVIFSKVYRVNNCFSVRGTAGRNSCFTVYGRQENIFLACELFSYIEKGALRLAQLYCENKKEENEFLDGFALAICEKLENEPAWAIDADERERAVEYAKSTGASWVSGRTVSLRSSDLGRTAGAAFGLHKQAGGGGAQLRLA